MAHAPTHSNRLSREPSPYLRQHASNPVDWHPWGEEALALARAESRPILLSVGYSACHWCHVMAHESFEDAETARLMNAHFVNIKVDREERPDLDQIYQGVVQLMGQGGGWPLTVFLTPDLRPFFGGTYFPPEDRYGRPGFKKLLQALHEAWTTKPEEVERQAASFHEGLGELATYGLEAPPSALLPGDITAAASTLLERMDPVYGGFGTAPKFPNPMNVAMLLRAWRRSRDPALQQAVLRTLERMAQGGLYDQLGGGFHRYSTDQRWLVPHFEKMLYDNAQLLHLYAEAEQVAPRPLWRKVAGETVAYLQREMLGPDGAFYAAQDADSEGEEGRFFVWRPSEIAVVLPHERAELLMRHFGVTPQGNFEGGASVLEVAVPAEQLAQERGLSPAQVERELAEARAALLAARERRVKPGRDDKILAGWNGLAIRGLALAARAFGRPDWAELAAGAAHFVLAQMWDGERLNHTHQEGQARIEGFLEDYGGMAAGLTALYQATFNPRYLEAAEALVSRAEALFWDDAKQAYLSAPRGMKHLVVETYALFDNASPSGASTLTEAQVALAALTGQKAHLDRAERYLTRMRAQLQQNPLGYGHLLLAADAYLDGAAELTLAGPRAAMAPLLEVVDRSYAPTVAVALHDPKAPVSGLLREAFTGRDPVRGQPAAYLCRHFVCERPVTEPEELRQRLSSVR